jgi:hypothetical protein
MTRPRTEVALPPRQKPRGRQAVAGAGSDAAAPIPLTPPRPGTTKAPRPPVRVSGAFVHAGSARSGLPTAAVSTRSEPPRPFHRTEQRRGKVKARVVCSGVEPQSHQGASTATARRGQGSESSRRGAASDGAGSAYTAAGADEGREGFVERLRASLVEVDGVRDALVGELDRCATVSAVVLGRSHGEERLRPQATQRHPRPLKIRLGKRPNLVVSLYSRDVMFPDCRNR